MPDKENNYRKFKNLEEVNLAELWLRTTDRYKITVMVISFLFYPTVCRGVIQMWSCQSFGTVNYLISDMSVECGTDEHMTFVVLAAIFFILFVIGIPTLGVLTLHHYMPGIHFNPTLPINEFNPVAGRAFERKDRAELLKMKLEATQVFGFMWEGLQQTGWAPMWEWSVIMSRKVVIIMIILLLQNMEPNYQLTLALIIMFAYNLLHVKFHPYDLFYHDRLEMLSLISSEMTLFGGLLITFLNEDKETCLTNCAVYKRNAEASSSAIGYAIIFFNLVYLTYFLFGFLFHMYFVLVPAKCRCKKVEAVASGAHEKLHKHVPKMAKALLSNTNHKYLDHHEVVYSTSQANMKADVAIAMGHANQRKAGQKVASEREATHQKLQERLNAKKQQKSIEMSSVEGKHHGGGKREFSQKQIVGGKNNDAVSVTVTEGGDLSVEI